MGRKIDLVCCISVIDMKKQSSTVKSYISAVKSVLRDDGIILNDQLFQLNSLTKACKLVNDKVCTRLPIQRGLLRILLKKVEEHFLQNQQPYLAVMYQALFSTAYFGLFRVGELTNGDHPVKACDVHLARNKKKILFVLRTSKTHGADKKPQMIKITSKPLAVRSKETSWIKTKCPYNLLRSYIDLRGSYLDAEEPFFVFKDHIPVRPVHMRSTLKNILKLAGFNEKIYSTYGFRSGRASDLLRLKISVETIKELGRWRSNAVFTYLRR